MQSETGSTGWVTQAPWGSCQCLLASCVLFLYPDRASLMLSHTHSPTRAGRSPAGSTRGGSPLAGSPREPHFQYSRPRPASAAHPDGHSSPLRPATAVGDSALGHINTIMGNSSPAADQDPRPGQPIGHASDTTSPGEQQQQRQQQPVLAGSLQGAISAEPEPATELPRSLAGAAVPLRPSKAAPGDVPDDAADNWGTHAASPPTSHLEGDHPAGAASQPNVSNRDDARQASPAEEGDLRPSDSPGRASAAAPTVGEPASTSLEQPQAGSPGRNRQPAGARDRSRSGSRPLPVSTGVGGGSGSGATAAAGQGGSAAESDPGAEPAPLTGAEAAALRRQLAGVQQQLAVERQLVRASAREKADIDASLAELTRQVCLLATVLASGSHCCWHLIRCCGYVSSALASVPLWLAVLLELNRRETSHLEPACFFQPQPRCSTTSPLTPARQLTYQSNLRTRPS